MKRIVILFLFILFPQAINARNCDSLLINWSKQTNQPYTQRKAALREIIKSANDTDSCRCKANAYRRLGTLARKQGQQDTAIIAFVIAIKYAEKVNDTVSIASTNNLLGTIYYTLKNRHKAFTCFNEAFVRYALVPDYRGMADAGLNCATIRFEEHNLKEATVLCLASMQNRRLWRDTSDMGYNLQLLAQIAAAKNRFAEADHLLAAAITLFRKNKDNEGLMQALLEKGKQFSYKKNADSARAVYGEVYGLCANIGNLEKQVEAAAGLRDAFGMLQQIDSVLWYSDRHNELVDSLNRGITLRAALDAAEKYETEKNELALINEKALSDKRLLLILLLLALLLVFAVGAVFLLRTLIQRRKLREKETALQSANAMLEGQDSERERIARELHDRIGSMLSAVKLQFSSMEEQFEVWKLIQRESYTKALELLDETYEEVRRISHDLDTGLLSRFGLRTAMRQLVQVISSTNKLKVVFIDNDIDPLLYKAYETDLYRITQELLSNTIKYAGASEVSIQLSRNDNKLIYSYEDDGIGFDKTVLEQVAGIGFKNIFHRIARNNGSYQLETSPGNGLNLIIELNCHEGNTDNNS